jgi:hypothetical protein
MDTFLDLLILVVIALAAASLVATVLMFLVRNKRVKRICLYLIAALGLYIGCVGLRILWPGFPGQSLIAVLTVLTSIGSVVLERLSRDSKKRFLMAQLLAAGALLVAMINAFVW